MEQSGVCDDEVGVDYGEAPPVPIPNTEVKLTRADNTCLETGREDRYSPTLRDRGFYLGLLMLKATIGPLKIYTYQ